MPLAYLYIPGYPEPKIVELDEAIAYVNKCSDASYSIIGGNNDY